MYQLWNMEFFDFDLDVNCFMQVQIHVSENMYFLWCDTPRFITDERFKIGVSQRLESVEVSPSDQDRGRYENEE